MEVVWNEVRISEKKSSKSQLVGNFIPVRVIHLLCSENSEEVKQGWNNKQQSEQYLSFSDKSGKKRDVTLSCLSNVRGVYRVLSNSLTSCFRAL